MIGETVAMVTFQGLHSTPCAIDSRENYWKLIGTTGRVVELGPDDEHSLFFGSLLVKFDVDVAGLGLECHNPVPDTLWILKSDLRELSGGQMP